MGVRPKRTAGQRVTAGRDQQPGPGPTRQCPCGGRRTQHRGRLRAGGAMAQGRASPGSGAPDRRRGAQPDARAVDAGTSTPGAICCSAAATWPNSPPACPSLRPPNDCGGPTRPPTPRRPAQRPGSARRMSPASSGSSAISATLTVGMEERCSGRPSWPSCKTSPNCWPTLHSGRRPAAAPDCRRPRAAGRVDRARRGLLRDGTAVLDPRHHARPASRGPGARRRGDVPSGAPDGLPRPPR